MSKIQAVSFTAKEKAALVTIDAPVGALKPDEVQGHTLFSLISPGTEVAADALGISANASVNDDYPKFPGYSSVIKVESIGADVKTVKSGDVVFCMGGHRSFHRVAAVDTVLVPSNLPPEVATLSRLMGVSMTTLTTTSARPGDRVLVIGLGPIGYLCSQIFKHAGYDVLGCDPDAQRQQWAREGGIRNIFKSVPVDGPAFAKKVALAIDCAGHEQAVLDASNLVQKGGEVVLVAVPWQRKTDVYAHALLNSVFRNYVVLRTGWEWELPLHSVASLNHSIYGNLATCLRWLADGAIHIEERYTVVKPADCQAAYQSYMQRTAPRLFTIFDWRKI